MQDPLAHVPLKAAALALSPLVAQQAAAAQPLMEPMVMPLMKYFWKARKMIRSGMNATVAAAMVNPRSVPAAEVLSLATPAGRVYIWESVRTTSCHMYWFQPKTKEKIPTA